MKKLTYKDMTSHVVQGRHGISLYKRVITNTKLLDVVQHQETKVLVINILDQVFHRDPQRRHLVKPHNDQARAQRTHSILLLKLLINQRHILLHSPLKVGRSQLTHLPNQLRVHSKLILLPKSLHKPHDRRNHLRQAQVAQSISLLKGHQQVTLLRLEAVADRLKHLLQVDDHAHQGDQIKTAPRKDFSPTLKIAINFIDASMKVNLLEDTILSVERELLGISSCKHVTMKMP